MSNAGWVQRPAAEGADLDELVDGVAQETGRDEDEGDARPLEEHGQIDAPAAAVEAVADHHRDQQPDDRAGQDRGRAGRGRRGLAGEEQRGLDPLANDRGEREQRETPRAAGDERLVDRRPGARP